MRKQKNKTLLLFLFLILNLILYYQVHHVHLEGAPRAPIQVHHVHLCPRKKVTTAHELWIT